MYFIEWFIIGCVWFVSFGSLLFIPKQKYRQAAFIFLFAQLPAWILGLVVVEMGWIEYPVRELSKANATSFTFEYLVLPILCIFFNLYFPEYKSPLKKGGYYIAFVGIFTVIEYFTERFTFIVNYIHWEWYTTFITMAIMFYFVRSVYKWFICQPKPFYL